MHKKAIEVDAHLRVKGAPVGEVYAIGDASTVRGFYFRVILILIRTQIETSIVSHLLELVDEADKDNNGKIDFDEWQVMGICHSVLLSVLKLTTLSCSGPDKKTHPNV